MKVTQRISDGLLAYRSIPEFSPDSIGLLNSVAHYGGTVNEYEVVDITEAEWDSSAHIEL